MPGNCAGVEICAAALLPNSQRLNLFPASEEKLGIQGLESFALTLNDMLNGAFTTILNSTCYFCMIPD